MGAGVAFLDYDVDGWLDAYLTNGSSLEGFPPGEAPTDALFRNRGDGTFADVTAAAGLGDERWTQGVSVADVDADGRPDVYLTNWGPNVLYLNSEQAMFRDVTAERGGGDGRWSTGAAFLDHDRDGDLDLYVANYVEFDADDLPQQKQEFRGVEVNLGPRGLPGARDTFYRNDDGVLVDATVEVGIEESDGYGFQVVVFDHNEDGWIDVYVGNDSTPNYLWTNDGQGFFVERAFQVGLAVSLGGAEQAAMGVAVGDGDGDGRLDLFVTNFSGDYSTFYRNDGGNFFSDGTLRANLTMATLPNLGWGCGFVDLDLDGDRDLFCANGHVYPQVDMFDLGTRYRQRNQVFENTGGGRFREATAGAGPGFALELVSRGAAMGDFDNDGDVDLLIGNLDGPPTLLRNESPARGHWLKVELHTAGGHRGAVGARLALTAGGRRQVAPVGEMSGFLSSNESCVHFGLGEAELVEELVVRWPSGREQRFRGLRVDRLIVLKEGVEAPIERP